MSARPGEGVGAGPGAAVTPWAPALAAAPFAGPGGGAVRDAAAAGLTDLLASALAGRAHPDVARLRGTLPVVANGVAVAGQPGRYSAADAALLGGFQAHVLDLDDAHAAVRGHPSAVLLPALLALADDATTGEDLLSAYVVGVEVMARLGALAGRGQHAAGWHPTGTLGGIAAAVAGARLLGAAAGAHNGPSPRASGAASGEGTAGEANLGGTTPSADAAGADLARTADAAASVAASSAAGTRAQFGSAAKPLHAGLAAAAGVRALAWARAGLTGNPGALFGSDSLAAAMGFDVTDPAEAADALGRDWGSDWAIADLWVKRYPFCSAGMAVHEAAERVGAALAGRSGAGAADEVEVRAVRAIVRPGADAALRHRIPATGAEGRFSLEYLVALGVLGRAPSNARFVDLDPAAIDLAGRVAREYEGEPTRQPWARVEATLRDGTVQAAEVGEPLGSPGRPLTPGQRRAKLEQAVGGDAAHRIEAAVTALPGGTVADLRRALAAATEEETP